MRMLCSLTSARVGFVTESLTDSACDGVDVLERTGQLNSDRIGVDAIERKETGQSWRGNEN